MKKSQLVKTVTLVITLILMLKNFAYADNAQENTDNFGPFGTLHIYKNSAQPKLSFCLFQAMVAGIWV